VSSRLMTALQTAAFPFRHCTGLAPTWHRIGTPWWNRTTVSAFRAQRPAIERKGSLVRVAGHDPAASASQARRSAG
jgi:hypothetical protein